MNTIFVGYDLDKPGQNYDDLIQAIKNISNGTWWHHLDSTWLIRTELSPTEVRDNLREHLDSNDELLAINVTGDARAWYGYTGDAAQWLHNNF